MTRRRRLLLAAAAALIVLALGAFPFPVPQSWVYGTYVASYPYGTSTIVLHRNGTFTQRVALKEHVPVEVQGQWHFGRSSYSKGSVVFDGSLDVQDGFGHLNRRWRAPNKGLDARPLSMMWLRIQMDDSSVYQYIKQ